MKSSIKKYTTAATFLLLLGSCKSDFLDRVNPNLPVEETYWALESDAQAAMPTIYSPIRSQMSG